MKKNASATQLAGEVVNRLREKTLLSEVPRTEIAKRTNVDRMTITRRLHRTDMTLSAFFAMSKAIGVEPEQIIADVINKKNTPGATGVLTK